VSFAERALEIRLSPLWEQRGVENLDDLKHVDGTVRFSALDGVERDDVLRSTTSRSVRLSARSIPRAS
jgi:hypothetical protein